MKIYPSFYLVMATFAHVTVGDAGDWSDTEYKKDPKDFRLKNKELTSYEMNYKSKFSENRRHSRKDKMETPQRSLYNKRHNFPPPADKNENSSQESERKDSISNKISHDAGLQKAWKRKMPIRRPARDHPVRMGKRMFADRKKKTNRKVPLRLFGIRQNKKKSFMPRKADAVERYRQLLIKSGQLQKFRSLGKTQQIELLRSLIRANRNAKREKQPEHTLQPWKTTTQSTMKSSYSIESSKTPFDARREMVSSKYNNANPYRFIGNHGRHIPKPPAAFTNGAAHKKNSDRKQSPRKKLSRKETHADSLKRQESSLENMKNRHQKPVSTLATESLSSRVNMNGKAFMLNKNSDSIHYRMPMRKNVFQYKKGLPYKYKKGNTGSVKSNESETKKGGDEDESKEEKNKEEKGNNEPGNDDDVEKREKVKNSKDDKETPENTFRNRNRRRKMNFRFPVNMKMDARLDNRRSMLRNRKYGFTRPAIFHNEPRHMERKRKTHLPSTVIPLRVYRKEDKGKMFEAPRNIPTRSELRENGAHPPDFVMIKHDNTKSAGSVRKDDQDSSEDISEGKKNDKVHKYHSLSPPSLNMAGEFQYGYRPVTYSMPPRPLYGRPDYYDQMPFVDMADKNTRGQGSDENASSENDQQDGEQRDYNDDNEAPSYADMHGTDMTVGGDRTIDVHTFYDNNPMYMIPDQKPENNDDASSEKGYDDHGTSQQDSGSEEQDTPKHFQQTIHKNHDSPDTLLIVVDSQAKAKKKLNDRNKKSNFKRVLTENKNVSPVIKADHSSSSGILVILDDQKKSNRNNAKVHQALEVAPKGKRKTALNQKEFYNFTAREKFRIRPTIDTKSGSRDRGRGRVNAPPKRTTNGFRKSYNGPKHPGRKSALDNLLIELGTKENIFNIRSTNNGIKSGYHARISASKSLQEDRRHDVQADDSSNSTDMERVKETVANEHRNINNSDGYGNTNSSSPIETSAMDTERIPDPLLNLKTDTKTADMVETFVNGQSGRNSTLRKTDRNEKLRGIATKNQRKHLKSKYNPKYPGRKHKISPVYQRGGVDYVYGPLNGIPKHISPHSDDEEDDDSAEQMSPNRIPLYPDINLPPTGKLTPIYPSQLHEIYDYGNVDMHDADDDDEDGDDDDDDDDGGDINETQVVDVEPPVIPDHLHEGEHVDGTPDYNPHLSRKRGNPPKSVVKGLHSIHIPESLVHASISGTEEKTPTKEQPVDNVNPYYTNFNHLKSIIDLPPVNSEDYHAKLTDYTIDDDDEDDDSDDDTEEDVDDDDNGHFIEKVYPTDVIDHQHGMGNFHGDFQPFYGISHDHEDGHSSQEAVDTEDGGSRNFHDLTGIHSRRDDNTRDLHETVAGMNRNATTHSRTLEEHRNPGHVSIRTLYDKLPSNRDDILESSEDSPSESNSMGEEVAYIEKRYRFPNSNAHKAVLSDQGIYIRNVTNKAPLPFGLYGINLKHSLKHGQKEKISDEESTRSLEDGPSEQEFYAASFGRKQSIASGVQFRNIDTSLKGTRGRYRKFPVHSSRIYRIMNKGKTSLGHSKLYKHLKEIHERKARPRILHFGRFQNGSNSNNHLKDNQQETNNDSGNSTIIYYEDYPLKRSNSYVHLPRPKAIDSEESRADRSSHEHGPGLDDGSDDFRDDTAVTSERVYYKNRQSGGRSGTLESRHYQIRRINETRDLHNGTSELRNDDRDKQALRVDIGTSVSWNETVQHGGLEEKENASWHMGEYKDGIDVPITSENNNAEFGQYDSADSISLEYPGVRAAEFHDYIGKGQENTDGLEDMQGTPESKLPNLEGDTLYHDIYGTPESDLQGGMHYDNSYNYPGNVYSDYDYISGTAVSQLSQDESLVHGASGALPDGVLTGQEAIYGENHYPHSQQHNYMTGNGDGLFRYGEEMVGMDSGMEERGHSEAGRQKVSYGRDAGVIESDTKHYQDGRHEDIQKMALDKKISNDKFHERRFQKVRESRPEDANMFGQDKNKKYDAAVDNYESKYFASGNGAYFHEKYFNPNSFEGVPDATTPGSIQIYPSARNANLGTTIPTVGIDRSETLEIEKPRSQDITDTKRTWKHHKDIKGSAISGDDEGTDLNKMVAPRPDIINSENDINLNENKDSAFNLGKLPKLSHSVKHEYDSALPKDRNITFHTNVVKVNHTIELEPEREERPIQENYGRGWHELQQTHDTEQSSSDKMQKAPLIISKENKDNTEFPKDKVLDNETAMPGQNLNSLHDIEKTEYLQHGSISQNQLEAVPSTDKTKQSSVKDKQSLGPPNAANWGRSGHSITHKVPEVSEIDDVKTSRVKDMAYERIPDISPTRNLETVDSIQKQRFVLPEPGIHLNKDALERRNQYNLIGGDIFQHILPDILHNGEPDRSQVQTTIPTTKAYESIKADWHRLPVTHPVNPTDSAPKQKFLSGPEISGMKFSDGSPSFETEKDLFNDLKHQGAPDSLDVYPDTLNNRHALSSSSINDAVYQTDENILPRHTIRVNVSELESSLNTKDYNVLDEFAHSDLMDMSHFEGEGLPSFQSPSSSGGATVTDFSEGHSKAETPLLFNMFEEPLPGGNDTQIPFDTTDMLDLSSARSHWINVDDNSSLSMLDPFYRQSAPELSQTMTDEKNGKRTTMTGTDGLTDEPTASDVPMDNRKTKWSKSLENVKSHTDESSNWYTQSKLTREDDGKINKNTAFQLAETNDPGLSEINQLNNTSEVTMEYKPTDNDIMLGISDINELVNSDSLPGISPSDNLTDMFTMHGTSNSELPVSFQSPDLLQTSRLMDADVVHSLSVEKDLTSSHSLPSTFQRTNEIEVHRTGETYSSDPPTKSLPGDNARSDDIQIDSQSPTILSFTGKQVDIKTDPGDSKVGMPSFIGISREDRQTGLHSMLSVTKTATLTSKDAIHGTPDGSDPINTETLTKILHSDPVDMDTLAGISHSSAVTNRGSLIGKSHRSDPDVTDSLHRSASGGTDTSLTETIHGSNQISMDTQEAGISHSNRMDMDPITRLSDNTDPVGIDRLVEISLSTNPKDTNSMLGVLNSNDPTHITYPDPVDTDVTKISHSSSPVDTDTPTGISHISDPTGVDILNGQWTNSDMTPLDTLSALSHISNASVADRFSNMFQNSDRFDIERLSGISHTHDLTETAVSHSSNPALTRTLTTNQGHAVKSDASTDQSYRGTPEELASFSLISQSNDKMGIDMFSTSSRIDNLTGIHEIKPSHKPMQTLTGSVKAVHSDREVTLDRSQTNVQTSDGIKSSPDPSSIPTGLRSTDPIGIDTMLDINDTTFLHSLPEISHGTHPILSSDSQHLPTLHDTFYGRGISDLHTETIQSSDPKSIDTFRSHTDTIHNTDLTGTKDISLIDGLTHLYTDEHNLNPSSVDGESLVSGSTLSQSGTFHRGDPPSNDRIAYVPPDKSHLTDPAMDRIREITPLHTDGFYSSDPTGLDRMAHVSGLSQSQTYMAHGDDLTGIDGVAHTLDPTDLSSTKFNYSDLTNKTLSAETSKGNGPSDLLDTLAEASHSSDLLGTDRFQSSIDPSSIDKLTGVPISTDLFTLPGISYSDPLLDLHTLSDKNLLTILGNGSQSSINTSYVAGQTDKDTSSTLSKGDGLIDEQSLFRMPTDTETEIHTVHSKSPTGDQTDMRSLPETSYAGSHSDGHVSQSPSSRADRLNKEFLSSGLSFIDGLTAVDTMPKLSLGDLQTGALPKLSHAEGLALSQMLDTGLTDGLTLPGASKSKALTDQYSVTHSQAGFESSPSQSEDKGMGKVEDFITGISSKGPIDVGFENTFQSSWRDLLLNHSRGFNLNTAFEMEQTRQPQKMNASHLIGTTSENPLAKSVGPSHLDLSDHQFSLDSFLGGSGTKIFDTPKTNEPDHKIAHSWNAPSLSSSFDSSQGGRDFQSLLDLPSTFLFGQLMNDSLHSTNLDLATADKKTVIPLMGDSTNGETQDSTSEIKNITSSNDKEGLSPQEEFTSKLDSVSDTENLTRLQSRVNKTPPTAPDMSAPFDLSSLFGFADQTRRSKSERTTSRVTASDEKPIFLTIPSMESSNPSMDLDPGLIPVVQHLATTRVPPKYDVSTDIPTSVSSSDISQTRTPVRTIRKAAASSIHAFHSTIQKENTGGQFSSEGGVVAENVPLPKFSSVTSQDTMHSDASYSDPYLPEGADTSTNRSLEETHRSHSQNDSKGYTDPFVLNTQTGSGIVKGGTANGMLSLNLMSSESENQNFFTGVPLRTNAEPSKITEQFDRSAASEFPTMIEDFDKAYLLKFHIPEDQSVTKEFENPLTTTDRTTEKTFWWMTGTSDRPDAKSSLMSFTLPESTFIHTVVPNICAGCINHIWEGRQGFMLGMHDIVDFKKTTFKRDPEASYYLVDSTYDVIRSLNLNMVQRQICTCILSEQPIQKIQVLCEHQMNGRLIHVELPNKRRDTEMQCDIQIYNGTWQGFKSCKEGQRYCDHMFGTRFGECTYALGRNELLKYYSMCNTVLCREAGDMKQWKKDACDVLDALAHQCELVGTKVAWREVTKCYRQCPENMEFKTNVSVCRRTCSNFDVGYSCPTTQTESRCDCQDGFVLSQETCIPMQECGCTYQGHYINIGETLSLPGCKALVACIADGNGWSQIKMIEIPGCSPRQSCQMVNGSYGCIVQCGGELCHENATCEEDRCQCNAGLYGDGVTTCLSTNDTCTCLVSGLSRYRTYDGQMLNYVATCPMELTRTVDNSNPSTFAVYGTTLYNSEQMMMFGTRRYRTVNITLNGLKIYMDTIGDIYVDEVRTSLPFQDAKHNVSASSSGGWTTVCSGDGVYVSYDRKHRVKIFLPKTYREKLTGMCGNCNGELEDDFYEKHKDIPSSVDLVGASYMLNSSFTCGQVSSINKCPEGVERCEIMRSGVFADCHPYLDPGLAEAYYESCMQMTCAFKTHKDYLKKLTCAALESLDTECMNRGFTVQWRSQNLCPIFCCRPMVYNKDMNVSSGSNCVSTPPVCPAQPVDGCVCGEGYVLDNNKCVLPQDCGCWYNNSTYIQLGETYHVPGCHLMIQCRKVATGRKKLVVTHLENGCGKNSKCVLKDHKHQCLCEEGFARNKNETLCLKIPECGDHPVDVVFVVDISGSINMTGLNSTKHFLAHFINSTNIGPNNMQVSILLFNDKPHNLFQLNKYAEKQQMLTALHTIGPPEGTTYLGRALVFVALVSLQEKMGARENVNQVVIILTDGILHDAERAERWSALLRRQKQAELFAIGVGEADPAQLRRLTRNKNSVFYVREYEKLDSIMDNLLQGVCK